MIRRQAARLAVLTLAGALVFAPAPRALAAGVWPPGAAKVAIPTQRLAGANRYATAASIARATYPGWAGVHDVVIVCGDDRAAADPLAAAGLAWAYDAPMLLVRSKLTPSETKIALRQIVSANTTVTVHVVGGRNSVPPRRIAELRSIVGASHVEQPWVRGNRYALAAGVAARTWAVAAATSRTIPSAVFVANGDNAKNFWDALAVSAITRRTGIPILLTGAKRVPSETVAAIRSAGSPEVIVVGGTGAVSAKTAAGLHAATRWAGANRFHTSALVARYGALRGWTGGTTVTLAVRFPDALAGACLVGRDGGALLFTDPTRINPNAWSFLANPPVALTKGYVLGGPASLSVAEAAELAGAPAVPWMGAGTPGGVGGSSARVAGGAGGNTTQVTLVVNGSALATRAVVPWGAYDFGKIGVGSKGAKVAIVASNPDGGSAAAGRSIKRLSVPYRTCIIIVKHEFRLYWIKDWNLVASYPIAIGRDGMETPPATWKVLAKYKTSGVYGPRKMRLFRQRGRSFVFTRYGIHGTNQEWVIGTKASHGCIRMYNRDILKLWPQVRLGTHVVTRQ